MDEDMEYEKKLELMRSSYRDLLERIKRASSSIPSGVDKKKLDKACDLIANEYVWVLKKRSDTV